MSVGYAALAHPTFATFTCARKTFHMPSFQSRILFGLVALSQLFVSSALGADDGRVKNSLQKLSRNILVVVPDYPPVALASRTQGEIEFEFGIDSDGRATGITIVNSRPSGIFDSALMSVLGSWLFLPNFETPCNIGPEVRARQRVWFELDGERPKISISKIQDLPIDPRPSTSPTNDQYLVATFGELPQLARISMHDKERLINKNYVQPYYPESLLKFGKEGYFVINVHVNTDGTVREVRVPFGFPRGRFEDSINFAAKQWQFETTDGRRPGQEFIACTEVIFKIER